MCRTPYGRASPTRSTPMRIPTKIPTTRASLAATATNHSRWFAALVAGTTVLGAPLALAVNNEWTGATNADWNEPTNWSLGRVPANPNGATEGETYDDAIVNIAGEAPPFPVLSTNPPANPRDIYIGFGAGQSGRFDMRGGTIATGGWMFFGRLGGTGTFNLADTSGTGGAFTGFAEGTGSFSAGRLYLAAWDGAGTTGTVNVNTSGSLAFTETIQIGAGGGNATLNIDAGAVSTGNWTEFGNGAGSTGTLNMSGGTLTKTGDGNTAIGTNGGTGFGNQTGGTITVNNEFYVGQNGGTGTYNLSGTGVINSAGHTIIGRDGGNGTMNHSGGTLAPVNGELWVGQNGGSVGVYNLSDSGVVNANNWVAIGRDGGTGTFNMTGGTFTKGGGDDRRFIVGASGPGTWTQSAGLVDVQTSQMWLGENNSGTYTLSGSGELRTPNDLIVALNGSGTGVLNLDGGTLRTSEIAGGGGNATVRFNGTQIVATANNETFIGNLDTADVAAGGVKIDTNGMTVGVLQSLVDGGGGGGLTKTGTGTLNLNAFNTYTGATLVSEGTLGGTGTVSGAITVEESADLSPGVSTGVLAADSVDFTGAATLTIDADDTAPVAVDRLDVTNNLNLTNAALVLNGDLASKVYVIATYGTLTGTFSPAPALPAGYSINYAYQGNKIALTRAATAFDTFIEAVFPEVEDDPAFLSPAADPDGDGTANSVEFALGGDPADPADGPKVYQLTADSSDGGTASELLLTIAVRAGTPAFTGSPSPTATSGGYTYTVEGSTDLVTFATPVTVVSPVTAGLAPVPGGYEYRTFSLSGSDGLPSRGFLRVQVTP